MIFFNYYTLGIIVLPGILLSLYAQIKVNSTYHKYSQIATNDNRPAHEIARMFLDLAGLHDIKVIPIGGHLSDFYNPRTKTIGLSEGVYNSTSIAAAGIACHEVGHAIQYSKNYFPIRLRNFFIPICNFGNRILWFVIVIGIVFMYSDFGGMFLDIGIVIFALSTLLNLITLPVEFNASNRAVKLLGASGTLTEEECDGVKSVLGSAALTYIAGFVTSLLSLIRIILIFGRRRD